MSRGSRTLWVVFVEPTVATAISGATLVVGICALPRLCSHRTCTATPSGHQQDRCVSVEKVGNA